jgi:RNA polymerase sigma-70 factor (ECF subfamily)
MGPHPSEALSADAFLVQAVRAGDSRAWQEIISRYTGRLISFARKMLADRSEAEDLVQETFIGLLRSLPRYDPDRALETYLFAILRNKLHDHFRRQQPGQRQSLDTLEVDDIEQTVGAGGESPSQYAAGREALAGQRSALLRILRTWIANCCSAGRWQDLVIIEMLVVLGLRNKEVASDLDLSETAVAGVKFRVLEQWRRLAEAEGAALDWSDADLARDSTLGRVWREDGVSCPKRSTLGRHLLGALDPAWTEYIEFHVTAAGCPRCAANLEDLRAEEAEAAEGTDFRARCFASSVGFLSRVAGSE